jgi:hypothetical protein
VAATTELAGQVEQSLVRGQNRLLLGAVLLPFSQTLGRLAGQ